MSLIPTSAAANALSTVGVGDFSILSDHRPTLERVAVSNRNADCPLSRNCRSPQRFFV
jgi:hypothetical protein